MPAINSIRATANTKRMMVNVDMSEPKSSIDCAPSVVKNSPDRMHNRISALVLIFHAKKSIVIQSPGLIHRRYD